MAEPSLPGARRPVSSPPRARLRPAALGLSFTNQPPFSQSKMPSGENWPKVLLIALNNSPPKMSSHTHTSMDYLQKLDGRKRDTRRPPQPLS